MFITEKGVAYDITTLNEHKNVKIYANLTNVEINVGEAYAFKYVTGPDGDKYVVTLPEEDHEELLQRGVIMVLSEEVE